MFKQTKPDISDRFIKKIPDISARTDDFLYVILRVLAEKSFVYKIQRHRGTVYR